MRGACARPCTIWPLTDHWGGRGGSLAVLSLSSDRERSRSARSWQSFAASLGIPTALVIGPQQDPNATATLSRGMQRYRRQRHRDARATCGSPSGITTTSTSSQTPR